MKATAYRVARGLGACGVVIVAAAQLVGCVKAAEHGTAAEESPNLVASSRYPGAYRVLEEEVTGVDSSEVKAISDRVGQLVSRCMTDAGFADTPSTAAQTLPTYEAIYGAVDPEWASVYGYASPAWIATLGNENIIDGPNDAPPPTTMTMSPYDMALLGAAEEVEVKSEAGKIIGRYRPDGCYWKSVLAVQPDYFRRLELNGQFHQIINDAHQSVRQSDEYAEAESRWIKCMAAAGYAVSDPVVMPEVDTTSVNSDTITEAQRDIECKSSTRFLKVWSRLLAEEEARAFSAHPGLIEELTKIQADDYRRATNGQ